MSFASMKALTPSSAQLMQRLGRMAKALLKTASRSPWRNWVLLISMLSRMMRAFAASASCRKGMIAAVKAQPSARAALSSPCDLCEYCSMPWTRAICICFRMILYWPLASSQLPSLSACKPLVKASIAAAFALAAGPLRLSSVVPNELARLLARVYCSWPLWPWVRSGLPSSREPMKNAAPSSQLRVPSSSAPSKQRKRPLASS
mmetsp:Transcript_17534/g.50172  ORF Transcript_17534/g.50172 Transcript_17534/m.50172 type:complete len:204 (+) Transcript_17534:402-1013(+)